MDVTTALLVSNMMKKEEKKNDVNKKSKIIDKETIKERTKTLEEAKVSLKREFFGIDKVIDEVFEQIKTWYIYPEYLSRPTIINLWGLTGVGKTDFVKKLRMYLKITSFCEIETDSNAETAKGMNNYHRGDYRSVIEAFDDAMIDTKYPSIILFDEIHRFRTLNEKGDQVPKKQYSDIWRLLSDGTLTDESYVLQKLDETIGNLEHRYNNIQLNNVNNAKTLADKICYVLGLPVQKSEEDKKNEEALKEKFLNDKGYIPYEIRRKLTSELDSFNNDSNNTGNTNDMANWITYTEEDFEELKRLQMIYQGPEELLVNEIYMNSDNMKLSGMDRVQDRIAKFMRRSSNKVILEFYKYIRKRLINEKANLTGNQMRMRELEYVYSKALIFICGNLPKSIYEEKKDNVLGSDVQEFLRKLFMPEQISRFGNAYIVYPILDKEVYDDIIEKEIHLMEEKLNDDFDTNKVKFDVDSVKKEVYESLPKDYLYNGVRPIYSEVQRVLSKIIPNMIIKITEEKSE